MIREIDRQPASGYLALLVLFSALAGDFYLFVQGVIAENPAIILPAIGVFLVIAFLFAGLFMVNPNESRVLQLFGTYVGSVKLTGLKYANPFYSKKRVSLRVRNFETEKLKVNDKNGNPIEIGAVVVWKVVDSAEALFEVDDYEEYVHVQSEAALRGTATSYPYESHEVEGETALSSHLSEIAERLKHDVQARLDKAGVNVIEARISHLAYAPEIASAMLQRQQASAIIAARQKIVEGAVGMVQMALAQLAEQDIVHLDDERRAAMVSNLLVVLCGERATQPVVNTGTIYT